MTVSPYVFFNGNCRAAFEFYARVFGSEPVIMDMSGMPPEYDVPEDRKDWVMHGHIQIGHGMFMASDDVFGDGTTKMTGCSVQLNFETAAEAKAIFDKLSDGAEITMAWTPTFWSAGFGTLTDRFGVRWMVGCEEQPS